MKTKNFGKDMIRPTGNLGSVKSLKNSPRKPNPVENSPTETQSSNVLRYVRRPRPNSATTQRCSGLEYSYNVHQGGARPEVLADPLVSGHGVGATVLPPVLRTDRHGRPEAWRDERWASATNVVPVEVCRGAAQKQGREGFCQTQHPEAVWLCSADLTENRSHID